MRIVVTALLLLIANTCFANPDNINILSACNMEKIQAQSDPSYENTFSDMLTKLLPARSVKWTSCYRTVEQQRNACQHICGRDSCPSPNNCAPPGASNHQKVSTADISGLPGSADDGCNFLFKVCQAMKAQNKQLGCEIGSYGAGANHLAVGPGIGNMAYNQCSFLRGKMGLPPEPEQQRDLDQLQDNANHDYDNVFKSTPSTLKDTADGAAAASALGSALSSPPSSQGNSSSVTGGSNSPPDATSGGPQPSPPAASAAPPSGTSQTAGGSSTEKVQFAGPDSTNPPPAPGETGMMAASSSNGYASGISKRNQNSAGASAANGTAASAGGSSDSVALSSPASASSSSATHSGSAKSMGSGAAAGEAMDQNSEALSSFAGGSKLGGGVNLGSDKAPADSGTNASLVGGMIEESQNADRAPSSIQSGSGVGEEEGETLFGRCHTSLNRCLMRGCVSTK